MKVLRGFAQAAACAAAAAVIFLAAPCFADAYTEALSEARRLAREGDRAGAIAKYDEILAEHPGDPDALLGRGTVLSWEKRYVEAERDLRAAAARAPEYADIYRALGNLYLWTDRFDSAAWAYAEWARLRPGDTEPLEALAKVERAREAARVYPWEATVGGEWASFSEGRSSHRTGSVAVAHRWAWGKGVLQANATHRFGRGDEQVEGWLYPKLWRRAYADIWAAVAPSATLYPRVGYAIAVYQGLPGGWEVAPGYRHMEFGSNNVDIYTLSLGKYLGNWFFRAIGTRVPNSAGASESLRYEARYYFGEDRYFYGTYGHGSSPEKFRDVGDVSFRNNESFGGGFEWFFTRRWGLAVSGSYRDEAGRPVRRELSASVTTRW